MKSGGLLWVMVFLGLAAGCTKDSDPGSTNANSPVIPNDFLSDKKYTSLVVEVVYVNGFQPSTTGLDNMRGFIQGLLTKPGGITVSQKAITSPGKAVYSLDDIKVVETSNRAQKANGSVLTAYIFFADADYAANAGNSKVLGIAYGGSSMAIFEKTVKEFSGSVGKPSASVLETTVLDHEFGHILGLVNNGTHMQGSHQDTANGKHCAATNCLMYYQVETSDFISNLTGGAIPSLDAACMADLKANGGK